MPRSTSQVPADTVRAAEFVFFGTVKRIGASNVAQVEGSSDVAIVRAEEVIVAPPSLGDVTRRDLTVRLSSSAKVGSKALFFASSWVLSDEIAVIELARVSGRFDRGGLRDVVLREKLSAFDDELLARIASADVVVRGRVGKVSTIEIPPEQRDDEELAWWRVAMVEVLDVLKGRPEPTVRIAFLDPRPPRWFDAPIFAEGQEGIWFLRTIEHTPEWSEIETVPERAYTALHPLDYQAPGLFAHIHTLAAGRRSGRRVKT
jgi:hypothetical protein